MTVSCIKLDEFLSFICNNLQYGEINVNRGFRVFRGKLKGKYELKSGHKMTNKIDNNM